MPRQLQQAKVCLTTWIISFEASAQVLRRRSNRGSRMLFACGGHPVVCDTIPQSMNRSGMRVSDWVHLGEIALIWTLGGIVGPLGLPPHHGVDISAATPISCIQGRDHGD
jgi:hypothetical protein